MAGTLATVAILIAAPRAYGVPIRFDNPPEAGHFVWYGGGSTGIGLQVTGPAGGQSGATGPSDAFGQENVGSFSLVQCYASGRVQATTDPFLVGVDAGVLIPSGIGWGTFGYANYPGYPSPLPYDEETYLGVKFDLGPGDQYGWIGVVFSSADYTLDAFAWGYETDVGVPIPAGAPEPGTLAVLAVGAAAVLARRRRAPR